MNVDVGITVGSGDDLDTSTYAGIELRGVTDDDADVLGTPTRDLATHLASHAVVSDDRAADAAEALIARTVLPSVVASLLGVDDVVDHEPDDEPPLDEDEVDRVRRTLDEIVRRT